MSQNENSQSDWSSWESEGQGGKYLPPSGPGTSSQGTSNQGTSGQGASGQKRGASDANLDDTNPAMQAQQAWSNWDAAAASGAQVPPRNPSASGNPFESGYQSSQGTQANSTQYFGQQPYPSQSQGQQPYQQQYQGSTNYPPAGYAVNQQSGGQASSSTLNAIAVALGVLLLLLVVGAGSYFYFAGGFGNNGGAGDDSNASASANADNGASAETTTTTTTQRRAENFTPPSSWNQCGGSGAAGDLNLYYAGSSVTSCPFAGAVRDAFVSHYASTGKLSGTIRAYSPVTGRSYTMNCNDNGDYVTCTGGNNAVVHIL